MIKCRDWCLGNENQGGFFDAYGTFVIQALPVRSNVRAGTGENRP